MKHFFKGWFSAKEKSGETQESIDSFFGNNRSRPEQKDGGIRITSYLDLGVTIDRNKAIRWTNVADTIDPNYCSVVDTYGRYIGTPTPHFESDDIDFNDRCERFIEYCFKDIYRHPFNKTATDYAYALSIERLKKGEVYAVFLNTGRMEIITSEMVGSPDVVTNDNEDEGFIYDKYGDLEYIRVGKVKDGNVIFTGDIDELIPAKFVDQLSFTNNSNSVRGYSPLFPSQESFEALREIRLAKVAQVKNQASLNYVIKKNSAAMAQAIAAIAASSRTGISDKQVQQIVTGMIDRSKINTITNGSVLNLKQDESFEAVSPSINADDYSKFRRIMLEDSAGFSGVIPEESTTGYYLSNYSSSRGDRLKFGGKIDFDRISLTNHFNKIQYWLRMNFGDDSVKYDNDGNDHQDISFGWKSIPEIDRNKEESADAIARSAGTKTLGDVLKKNGEYADDKIKDFGREAKMWIRAAKALEQETGLPFDTCMNLLPYKPNTTINFNSNDNNENDSENNTTEPSQR